MAESSNDRPLDNEVLSGSQIAQRHYTLSLLHAASAVRRAYLDALPAIEGESEDAHVERVVSLVVGDMRIAENICAGMENAAAGRRVS